MERVYDSVESYGVHDVVHGNRPTVAIEEICLESLLMGFIGCGIVLVVVVVEVGFYVYAPVVSYHSERIRLGFCFIFVL